MSKLTKLMRDPVGFFRDGIENRLSLTKSSAINKPGKPSAFLIGFSSAWKPILAKIFKDKAIVYISINIDEATFNSKFKERLLKNPKPEIYVWGFKTPEFIINFIKKNKLSCKYVEDGFIRSVHLGSSKAPPRSWCFDSRTPYFDSRTPSDLENLLSTYDFQADSKLIARSKELINTIVNNNISKYNNSLPVNVHAFYGKKTSKRILVIGQVEDDASIKYGCNRPITNFDLLSLACDENPDAQIFYKEHPDVLTGNRQNSSDMEKLKSRCHLLAQDFPLSQALETIDHVYTITSLSGFEALMRDIKVTSLGCPFYSNWGLTDDRQPNPRRKRKLTKEQLFAGAYILYPTYFDPESGEQTTLEETLQAILTERAAFYRSNNIAAERIEFNSVSAISSAKNGTGDYVNTPSVPEWFKVGKNKHLAAIQSRRKPVLLYPAWSDEYSSTLFSKIKDDTYDLIPLELFNGIEHLSVQKQIQSYALQYPEQYRKLLLRQLIPLAQHVSGIIFTLDHSPVMRVLSHVCQELNIKRIVIPVDQVFANPAHYYKDPTTQISLPAGDVILAGGKLQRDIFVERGYDPDRIEILGSVYFDEYANYHAQLSHDTFSRVMRLSPSAKTILFLYQAEQRDKFYPQQEQVLETLLHYAQIHGHQLLIKLPGRVELASNLRHQIDVSGCAVIDDEFFQSVSDIESLYHSDIICAIEHPLLFNSTILNKPAIALSYANTCSSDFSPSWYKAGIIQVVDEELLEPTLNNLLEQESWKPDEKDQAWAAEYFSCGQFDGQAYQRIRAYLAKLAQQQVKLTTYPMPITRLKKQKRIDIAAVELAGFLTDQQNTRLRHLLQANTLLPIQLNDRNHPDLNAAELFIFWSENKQFDIKYVKAMQQRLGKNIAFMSQGFINFSLANQTSPVWDSIVLDSEGFYFDSSATSAMNNYLSSDSDITHEQLIQSRKLIEKIQLGRVGRYHSHPDIRLSLGRSGHKKILILDQASSDPAMGHPCVQQKLFYDMVTHALNRSDQYDIIIKNGNTSDNVSLLSEELKSSISYNQNVFLVDAKIHSHALLDLADEVYVIDDHLGFEALMAGKTVHSFGRPFYAGFGLTQDHDAELKRARTRTLESLFYITYVEYSRYLDPVTSELTSLDKLLDYYVDCCA